MFFLLSLIIPAHIIVFSQADFQEYKLNELAWNLAMCESSQVPDVVVQDDGGSPSYGFLQIKKSTFDWGCKRFKLNCTDIMDYRQQRELFKAFYRAGEWKNHWKVCSKLIK